MVVVWIEKIVNKLSRPVILYHTDPLIKPVVKGETYSGRPIILEPGFSDEVGWFNIPWRNWGDLMIDIDMPIKVVVGPHGAEGNMDWLQLYHYTGEAIINHWQELGKSSWWEFFNGGKQVRMTLTFADTRGGDARQGQDAELMHFVMQDSFNVMSVGDGTETNGAREQGYPVHGSGFHGFGFKVQGSPADEPSWFTCVGKRPGRASSKEASDFLMPVASGNSGSAPASPSRTNKKYLTVHDMSAADAPKRHEIEKMYDDVEWLGEATNSKYTQQTPAVFDMAASDNSKPYEIEEIYEGHKYESNRADAEDVDEDDNSLGRVCLNDLRTSAADEDDNTSLWDSGGSKQDEDDDKNQSGPDRVRDHYQNSPLQDSSNPQQPPLCLGVHLSGR